MKLSELIKNQEILDNYLFYGRSQTGGYYITYSPPQIDEEDLEVQVEIDLDLTKAQEQAKAIVGENPLMALDVVQQFSGIQRESKEGGRTIILSNAFPADMLAGDEAIRFKEVSLKEAQEIVRSREVDNYIGDADISRVIQTHLGFNHIPGGERRIVHHTSEVLLAQYIGPGLDEGATELPEGGTIYFWHIYRQD